MYPIASDQLKDPSSSAAWTSARIETALRRVKEDMIQSVENTEAETTTITSRAADIAHACKKAFELVDKVRSSQTLHPRVHVSMMHLY